MSRNIVLGLQIPLNHALGLVNKFIEVCPDEIWTEKKGGWPVWQQIYHALATFDLFIAPPERDFPAPLADADVRGLRKVSGILIPKAAVQTIAAAVKSRVDSFVKGLTNSDLPKLNDHLFAQLKMELNLAGTLSSLAGHTYYHLGSGDAALRDHQRPGVF